MVDGTALVLVELGTLELSYFERGWSLLLGVSDMGLSSRWSTFCVEELELASTLVDVISARKRVLCLRSESLATLRWNISLSCPLFSMLSRPSLLPWASISCATSAECLFTLPDDLSLGGFKLTTPSFEGLSWVLMRGAKVL